MFYSKKCSSISKNKSKNVQRSILKLNSFVQMLNHFLNKIEHFIFHLLHRKSWNFRNILGNFPEYFYSATVVTPDITTFSRIFKMKTQYQRFCENIKVFPLRVCRRHTCAAKGKT